jgi:hypothetical protein
VGLYDAFVYMQDIVIELKFTDSGVDDSNFENPILRNVNSNNQLRPSLFQEKNYDFYLGNLNVKTKYGLILKKENVVTTLRMTNSFFDSQHREPTYKEDFGYENEDPVVAEDGGEGADAGVQLSS